MKLFEYCKTTKYVFYMLKSEKKIEKKSRRRQIFLTP